MRKKQRLPSILVKDAGCQTSAPKRENERKQFIFFKAQAVNSVSDALPPSHPYEIASEAFEF